MTSFKKQCANEDSDCWACPKGIQPTKLITTIASLGNGMTQVIFLCEKHDAIWQEKRKARAKAAKERMEVFHESWRVDRRSA